MATPPEAEHFQSGPWTEYATGKAYILVSERTASIVTIILAFTLWLSLLQSYKLIRKLSLFLLGRIHGVNQTQGQGIVMQNLSTGATVAAITHQAVLEEPSPEQVLFRLAEDYIFVNLVQLPNPASTPRNAFTEDGSNSYELDTGWVDANELGVNESRSRVVDDVGSRYVEYLYGDGWGTAKQGNKTFGEVVRDPQRVQHEQGDYLIRGINTNAVENLQSPRKWIPELRAPGSRVSLFFVRPVNIAYTRPSTDPIFPATKSSKFTIGDGQPLYINPLQRSSVFACADTFTIRHPMHRIEWQPRYPNKALLGLPEWKDPDVLTSLHMVNVSFLARTQIASRYSDMSMHFNAPRRIRSFYSSPLESEQWKVEVKKMFNTELALLQFNVRGIAQGLGHDLPRAKNLLQELGVDARGKVLFPSQGAKNIRVAELMGFVVGCMACWILTIECKDGSGQKVLWVTTLLRSITKFWRGTVKGKFDDFWVQIKDMNFDQICEWFDEKLGLA
ncbi:hypothetical protein N0V83_005458 [Neocucurbitaria cava]|uniref:Uncharacterized protein n=1 Tax=Neocucurbitaria cava TaxID=798079 RepID=A0A9W8YA49_9PLEO|nr:hypothetical protein N0V83_005458 [Neocucurbitaria cava]